LGMSRSENSGEQHAPQSVPLVRPYLLADQPLGAHWFSDNTCTFLVWAPHAKNVEVHTISPRERMIPMQPLERGYFSGFADDIAPGVLYRYRLDGQKERPDPASRCQPQGVHGPSQIVDPGFNWADDSWRGMPLETYIFYELHVGTFTSEGTFDAIIPRIAELKNLGVTALEIMPVAQFPGARNWGYDGVYAYAVQDSYGGPAGLKRLVDACHHQNMAVVLDVVYNHFGPEGNYAPEFGPYLTDACKTFWGNAINFDGPMSDEIRRFFIGNALHWITDFHIDALRVDAVHAIVDPSARPFPQELAAAVHARAERLERQIHVIAESDRNDHRIVASSGENGWGYDSAWNDDFHHALHVLLTGETAGYYEDFHGVDDLARAFREGFIYSGQYSHHRQRRHGNSSWKVPAQRFVVFSQSHDQIGNRVFGDRLSQIASFERLKLAAGTVLLSPYLPLLFMGEEYGEIAPFQYFVSHGDPALIEAVRKGRGEEFERFKWAGDVPDPASEETFRLSKLHWNLREQADHLLLRGLYQELLRLRREVPALAHLDKESLNVVSLADQNTLFITRWSGENRIAAAFHYGDGHRQLAMPVPAGRWQKKLDSADTRWGGQGSNAPGTLISSGEAQISLGAWAFVLYEETSEVENSAASVTWSAEASSRR